MGKEQELAADPEIAALMNNDAIEINSAEIAGKVAGKSEGGDSSEKKEGGETAKTEPKQEPVKKDEGTVQPKPDETKENVPSPETIRADMLNEMFGDRFATVEDVKKANILASLQELETLRQKTKDLETQIGQKPKHSFANDDLAKFNEFARETSIFNWDIFNELNSKDVANMNDMDALVLEYVIRNPRYASQQSKVRTLFETKYDLADAQKRIEEGDLTQSQYDIKQMDMSDAAEQVKKKLLELKSKIKMPEIPKEEPLEKDTKWTPEIEAKQKADWKVVNEEMYKQFTKLPIFAKGAKDPIVNFELPEEAKSGIIGRATDYIVSNQLEVNKDNVESVAKAIYTDIRDSFFEDIIHAVFERGRSITEKEYLEKYHNPSKEKNADVPAGGGEEDSDEVIKKRAYDAEMMR